MLEKKWTSVAPTLPGIIEDDESDAFRIEDCDDDNVCVNVGQLKHPEPPNEDKPAKKARVRFVSQHSEMEPAPKKSSLKTTANTRRLTGFKRVEGIDDRESQEYDDRTSTELIERDGKLMVRAKSFVKPGSRGNSLINELRGDQDESRKARTSSCRRRLKKKLQSIYGENDIYTDDVTAEHMKQMVMGFNDVSTNLDSSVEGQTFWALFGLVINVIQRELDYYTSPDYEQCDLYSNFDSIRSPWKIIVHFLRLLVTVSTFIMIYHFYRYHDHRVSFESLNKEFMAWENIWSSFRNYYPFFKDVLFYCAHEPPLIMWCTNIATSLREEDVMLPNGFGLLMFFRLFLILRYISTRLYTGGTKVLGIWHNFDFGLGFTIRNLLYVHPMRSLGPPILTLIAIAWYCLNSCERHAEGGFMERGLDSLWVLCVTVTTVGYGDIYPATECGRWTLVMTAFMSQLVVAVLISTLHQKLCLMPFESRMVEFLAHATSSKKLRQNAALVISRGWKYSKARKLRRGDTEKELKDLTDAIYVFERHRNTVQAYDRRYRNDQLIRSMLEDISKQTDEAKLYYSAANQLAAATGRALKMEDNVKKRGDGTMKGYGEAEYTVIDKRSEREMDEGEMAAAMRQTHEMSVRQTHVISNLESLVSQNQQMIKDWMKHAKTEM